MTTVTELLPLVSKPGDNAVYAFPENGTEFDKRRLAELQLLPLRILTITEIQIFEWDSRVSFEEFPGVWFNTVNFCSFEHWDSSIHDNMLAKNN